MSVQVRTAFASDKVLAVYDRRMLERAKQNQIFDVGAQQRVILANSNTKKGFAFRYKGMLPATTPIAEYNGSNIKNSNKVVREEVEFTVAHYGDYLVFTDELDLYDFDNIQSSFLDLLADQASLTVDTIRRNTLRGGTNVIYTDGATTRALVASGAKKHTVNDIKLMAIKLKRQGAMKFKKMIAAGTGIGTKSIRSAYIGITSPEVVEDLRLLAGWKDVEDYSDSSKAMPNEVGSIGDFRILESDNNDPVDVSGTNVYLSYFMGENAYCTTSLRSKGGIQTKVKPLGSAGAEDPLDQYGTVGWKAIFGCDILNEAWLIRTECTATIEDESTRHFIDYTV